MGESIRRCPRTCRRLLLGINRAFRKPRFISGIEGAEQFVPDECVEAEVVCRVLVMLGVEGGGSDEFEKRNGFHDRGKRLDAGMPERAENDVQGQVTEQSAQGSWIDHEEDDHQPAEADHLYRMEDKKTDRVRRFMTVVKPMDQLIDRRDVGGTVEEIHPEIHGQNHQCAVNES